jgi:inner membrane protein
MFIAHGPASYLFSQFLIKNYLNERFTSKERAWLVVACIMAGVIPDIDLLYFYLIDNRQNTHHSYLTHIPFFWVVLMSVCFFISTVYKQKKLQIILVLLSANLLLHLILDIMCGSILWLYPFSGKTFTFVTVPAIHQWWVWNFILHWTFLIEIIITSFAAYVLFKSREPIN